MAFSALNSQSWVTESWAARYAAGWPSEQEVTDREAASKE